MWAKGTMKMAEEVGAESWVSAVLRSSRRTRIIGFRPQIRAARWSFGAHLAGQFCIVEPACVT